MSMQLRDTQKRLSDVEAEYAEYSSQAQQELFGLEGRLLKANAHIKNMHRLLCSDVLRRAEEGLIGRTDVAPPKTPPLKSPSKQTHSKDPPKTEEEEERIRADNARLTALVKHLVEVIRLVPRS